MEATSTLQISLVTLLLLAGVINDMRSRKVRNPLVLGGLAMGLIFMMATQGLSGLAIAATSFVTAVVAILPLYLLRAIGGGDVKLLVAASVLMSWKIVLATIFASLVWGSLLGVLQALLRGEGRALAHNLLALSQRVRIPEDKVHKIPYTVALFFGFLSSLVLMGGQ